MRHLLTALGLSLALSPLASAQTGCDLIVPSQAPVGETFDVTMVVDVPGYALLVTSLTDGPTPTTFGTFDVGFPFAIIMGFPLYGPLSFTCEASVPCDPAIVGLTIYGQLVSRPLGTNEFCFSPGRQTQIVEGACLGTGTEPGDYRTQTQGGWGTHCNGNNPGCVLAAHFDSVFPSGLVIGDQDGVDADGDHALVLTSAAAVAAFLPAGSTGGPLTGDLVDPASSPAGVLAGQAVACTINVAFGDAGVFGDADPDLGDLVFVGGVHGDLLGLAVRDVLAMANAALASGDSGDLSFSDLTQALDVVNNNFVDGDSDAGQLALP